MTRTECDGAKLADPMVEGIVTAGRMLAKIAEKGERQGRGPKIEPSRRRFDPYARRPWLH